MKKIFKISIAVMLCVFMMMSTFVTASAQTEQTAYPENGDTVAVFHTNYGDFAMSFFEEDAPKGCENFITLAKGGKYDGSIFHRVIENFMIQGGDYTNGDGTGGESCWGEEFDLECVDYLKNIRGAVSYANRGPGTNGSQFFVNSADNNYLDGSYTVFGQVFAGMEVVDLISQCNKQMGSDGAMSKPIDTIELQSVEVTEYKDGFEDTLVAPANPYEKAVDSSNETTGITTEETDAEFNPMPLIIVGAVIVVIGAAVVIIVVCKKQKEKKLAAKKAARKAAKKAKKKN